MVQFIVVDLQVAMPLRSERWNFAVCRARQDGVYETQSYHETEADAFAVAEILRLKKTKVDFVTLAVLGKPLKNFAVCQVQPNGGYKIYSHYGNKSEAIERVEQLNAWFIHMEGHKKDSKN